MIFSFKDICGAREFGMVDPRISNVMVPELAILFEEVGINEMVFTSVHRNDRSDHQWYCALDIRVWALSTPRRHEIEREMNKRFPVPPEQRPTLKYWHPEKHRIRLQPANQDMAPIYVKNARVLGILVGVVRKV